MPKKWPPHRFPERVSYHEARQKKLKDEIRKLPGRIRFERMNRPFPTPPKKTSVKVQYSQSFPRTAPPPKVGLRRFRMRSQNKDNEEHLELPPIQPGQYPEQHESSGSLKTVAPCSHRSSLFACPYILTSSPNVRSPQSLDNNMSPRMYNVVLSPNYRTPTPNYQAPSPGLSISGLSLSSPSSNYQVPSPSNYAPSPNPSSPFHFPPTPCSANFGSQNNLSSSNPGLQHQQSPNHLFTHTAPNPQSHQLNMPTLQRSFSFQQWSSSSSSSQSSSRSTSNLQLNTIDYGANMEQIVPKMIDKCLDKLDGTYSDNVVRTYPETNGQYHPETYPKMNRQYRPEVYSKMNGQYHPEVYSKMNEYSQNNLPGPYPMPGNHQNSSVHYYDMDQTGPSNFDQLRSGNFNQFGPGNFNQFVPGNFNQFGPGNLNQKNPPTQRSTDSNNLQKLPSIVFGDFL